MKLSRQKKTSSNGGADEIASSQGPQVMMNSAEWAAGDEMFCDHSPHSVVPSVHVVLTCPLSAVFEIVVMIMVRSSRICNFPYISL